MLGETLSVHPLIMTEIPGITRESSFTFGASTIYVAREQSYDCERSALPKRRRTLQREPRELVFVRGKQEIQDEAVRWATLENTSANVIRP